MTPHRAAMIGSLCLTLGLPAFSRVRRSGGLHQIVDLPPIPNWIVAEVPHSAFEICVAEQQLYRAQILRSTSITYQTDG